MKNCFALSNLQFRPSTIFLSANNLKGVKEIIGPLKKIQTYLRETDELRMKLAREAAYRKLPDITEQDIKDFEKERFEKFETILKEYTKSVDVIPITP